MKQQTNAPEIVDLDQKTADEIVHRLESSNLPEQDRRIIRALFASYLYIVQLLQFKKITVARLKKFIFGSGSEKTEAIMASLGQDGKAPGSEGKPGGENASGEGEGTTDGTAGETAGETEQDAKPKAERKRPKGHGRNGGKDFPGAERQVVLLSTPQPGDDCPLCGQGPVYQWIRLATFIRFVAQPLIQATVYELQQVRCSVCGALFTAPLPDDVPREKYDPSVAILIALLRYGHGFPMNRIAKLQASIGIPFAPSTQYKQLKEFFPIFHLLYEELARQMAQADVVYHDDTGMRILSLMGKRREATLAAQSSPESTDSASTGGEPPPPDSGVVLTDGEPRPPDFGAILTGGESPLPDFGPILVGDEPPRFDFGPILTGGEPPPDTKCILPGGEPSPVDQQSTSAGGQGSLNPKRTGVFTTGIVATWREGRQAVLYVTGRQHAGENLRDLLNLRDEGLEPPIQMCDALSRNMPKDLETILANCLAHGRRVFVDICEHFPNECLYVLQAFKAIYENDGIARRDGLSPEERLAFHQTHSKPVADDLKEWLDRQLDQHLVEPNSALGGAIKYLLKHWQAFTLFLRKAGAPLDNNLCERVLKKAILHRKNSLFFKNENGAEVGDVYMSLIQTCELNGFNPWDYCHAVVRHQQAMAADPAAWMPWNYQQTVASLSNPQAPPAAAVRQAS